MKGFAYLNIENPYVAWEVNRGMIYSCDQVDNPEPVLTYSILQTDLFKNKNIVRLNNEEQLGAIGVGPHWGVGVGGVGVGPR
jgi:hypothetical protein